MRVLSLSYTGDGYFEKREGGMVRNTPDLSVSEALLMQALRDYLETHGGASGGSTEGYSIEIHKR